jgi:hypothetical protein
MNTYQVTESAIIDAPTECVYAIISDYHEGHQAILPTRYFKEMQVFEGGQGSGTIITVLMNAFGTKVNYTMTVSEPEPGRLLQEEDAAAGVLTTFTVEPLQNNTQSHVTITTTTKVKPGLRGWLEKLTTPGIARRIYREELAQLNHYAIQQLQA